MKLVLWLPARSTAESSWCTSRSVLGLLLFIVYINDIAEKLISLSRLFADDTSLSYSSLDELQMKTVIDHDLKELDEWSKNG
jgi:hypothetical protein